MKLFISGTGTEVGKTWLTCQLLPMLRERGIATRVYKPVESFDPDDSTPRDSILLAEAAHTEPGLVCPRQVPLAMAPPRAARLLGMPQFSLADLEIPPGPATDWVITEGAGGIASPIASDGDNRDFADVSEIDHVLVVSHAALGAVNACSLVHSYLGARPHSFFLNRFDPRDPLHLDNREQIAEMAPTACSPEEVLQLLIP